MSNDGDAVDAVAHVCQGLPARKVSCNITLLNSCGKGPSVSVSGYTKAESEY